VDQPSGTLAEPVHCPPFFHMWRDPRNTHKGEHERMLEPDLSQRNRKEKNLRHSLDGTDAAEQDSLQLDESDGRASVTKSPRRAELRPDRSTERCARSLQALRGEVQPAPTAGDSEENNLRQSLDGTEVAGQDSHPSQVTHCGAAAKAAPDGN
jgi:hypothetical protein